MLSASNKIERHLNVFGGGYTTHHQTGFNRSYYSHIGDLDRYLTNDSSNGIRSERVTTFAQVVQYGSVGEEFSSENEILAPSEYIINASGGENHSLFVTNHRRVFCCGNNSSGGCAMPDFVSIVEQVTLIPELTNCNIVETKCGNIHSFFISEGYGCVYAAGYNLHGECGVDTGAKNIYGVEKLESIGGKKLKYVAPGAYHTVFVTADNCVYSSGYCAFGSLGQGHQGQQSLMPQRVDHPDLDGSVAIKSAECGQWHSIVITESGAAYSWGYNHHGQCGYNSSSPGNVVSPALVTGIPESEKLVDAKCGSCFTVFRTESNNFYGCGENSHGALGLPVVYIQSIVTQIPLSLGTVLDYSCGSNFTVFTTKEGKVYACGERKFNATQPSENDFSEVRLPRMSLDSFYSELRVACAKTGFHTLVYSVSKMHTNLSTKLLATQQRGKLCDLTVILKE